MAAHRVFYDADCGVCQAITDWAEPRNRSGKIQLLAAQIHAPEHLRETAQKSMIVVTDDGRELFRGRAALFMLSQLGYRWLTVPLSIPPFVWIVEGAYRVIAANRARISRWLGLGKSCKLPR